MKTNQSKPLITCKKMYICTVDSKYSKYFFLPRKPETPITKTAFFRQIMLITLHRCFLFVPDLTQICHGTCPRK